MLAIPALDGCSTAWITDVENDMPEVLNIVASIISVVAVATGNGLIGQAASAAITLAAGTLKASLQTLSDAITAYKTSASVTTLGKLTAALTAAQGDIPKVLATLPTVIGLPVAAVITAGLGSLIIILDSLQTIVPGAAPASVRANMVAASAKAKLPNAATIRSGFYAVLMIHGYGAQLAGV
jgi:hypothetical protein